jgi:hypothetical protein
VRNRRWSLDGPAGIVVVMRTLVGLLALVVAAASAGPVLAGELGSHRDRRGVRTDLFLDVPLDHSTAVIFPFGGTHHAVPGVVAVNRAPYRCLVHDREFLERTHFVAHLRIEHGLHDDDIPAAVVVDHGQVVYLGQ